MSSVRRGNAGLFVLVFVLLVQTGLAAYYFSSWSAPHDALVTSGWSLRALVVTLCLSVVLMVLVSLGLVRYERGLRRRAETRTARLVQGADQADELVTVVNRRGRIEYVNRAVELTTGHGRAELVGRRVERWFPWYAEERASEEMRTRLLAGGTFRGTVSCRSKDGKPFLLQEHVTPLHEGRRSATRFLSTARDVTSQSEVEARLLRLERFDPLTGAPNRTHFTELLQDRLAQRRGGQDRLDVLIMDIDRFKYINDVFALEVGDHTLRRVTDVLRTVLGARGVIGRLGSDEFGVIHLADAHAPDASTLAAAILETLAQNTIVGGQDITASASIGVATCPGDGSDAATLLRNADIALSFAKSLGRNSVQSFSQEMSAQLAGRYAIQRNVSSALRRREYQVEYQPYCDLGTGRVSGAEALIRWNSEELGRVAPSEFIPALEDSGLILDVGEWVLRTACGQIQKWTSGHATATRRSEPCADPVRAPRPGRAGRRRGQGERHRPSSSDAGAHREHLHPRHRLCR